MGWHFGLCMHTMDHSVHEGSARCQPAGGRFQRAVKQNVTLIQCWVLRKMSKTSLTDFTFQIIFILMSYYYIQSCFIITLNVSVLGKSLLVGDSLALSEMVLPSHGKQVGLTDRGS